MSRKFYPAYILLACLAFAPAALADSVFGASGAGWQTWAVADLNENATPHWDRTSYDGAQKNIGYCLAGSGNCGMPGAPGVLSYWGIGTAADPDFYLQRSSTSGSLAALHLEISANMNTNEFGWYDTANQAGYASNVIFGGPASAPSSNVYIPTANYGFWFRGDQGVYFTQSSLNAGSAQGTQMFSIFQETAGQAYWLGMEDLHLGSDMDYNDLVVKISAVPDGGMTIMLLGGALVSLETLRRRFRS